MSSGTLTYPAVETPVNLEYGSESENEAEEVSSTNDDAAEIPVHTTVDSDKTLPDLTVDEPPVPPHVRNKCVMEKLTACAYSVQT